MHTWAHRIVKVEYADKPSFNLWRDQKLVEFLESNSDFDFYDQINTDGVGVVSVAIETMQKAIDQARELELDEDTVAQLKADVEADADEGSIDYDCF
ncbi:hypothetical protein ES703_71434 [subsurface metagenome]